MGSCSWAGWLGLEFRIFGRGAELKTKGGPKLKTKAVFVMASNHYWKCFSVNAGVWLRMENKFSRKYFQLTVCFSWFDPEIGFSPNFHFEPFSNSRTKRESLRLRLHRSTNPSIYESITSSTSPIYEPMNRSSTQSLQPTSLQLCRRPRAFVPGTDL